MSCPNNSPKTRRFNVRVWLRKLARVAVVSSVIGALVAQPVAARAAAILISGYMANPAGTDSPFEYVQLIATTNIDFSVTNYSVVWNNNGTATSLGWVAGGGLTYGFNLTSGSVTAGQVFYVGGNGKLINGSGTTSLAGETWIREINTGTTGGDGFGSAASAGVLGNGGGNADGIAVFSGLTSSLTATTIPVDALFFGTGVGLAKPASGGYKMPNNDRYTSTGVFGDVGNSFLFSDPASGGYTKLTGTFNTTSSTWTTARTSSIISNPTLVSELATGITLTSGGGPLDLTWNNHAGTGAWNTSDLNFTDGSSNLAFSSGDNVTFGNTAVGTVTVAAGGVSPGSITFQNTTGTYVLTGGSVGGSGLLTKNGAGTLALSAANSYGGGTLLSAGTLESRISGSIGAGQLTLAGGTFHTTTAAQTLANALNITGSSSIQTDVDTTFTTSALSSGAGTTLTKLGTAKLIFGSGAGLSNYAGNVDVNSGTLQMGDTSGTGNEFGNSTMVTVASPATLDMSWSGDTFGMLNGAGTTMIRANSGITLVGAFSGTYSGLLTAGTNGVAGTDLTTFTDLASDLTINSTATTLALTNASNSFAGKVTVNAGTLSFSSIANRGTLSALGAGNFNTTPDNDINLGAGDGSTAGTLQYTGGTSSTNRTIELDDGGGVIEVTNSAATLTLNGAIVNDTGETLGSLTKTGPGTLVINANSDYGGATIVNGGRLTIGSGVTLSGTTNANVNSGGELRVLGTLDSSGGVNVNNGGTLSGTGVIDDTVTINSGGILAPGTSPGTLSVTGPMVWNGGAVHEFDITSASGTPGTDWDQILVTDLINGTLTINATMSSPMTLKINPPPPFTTISGFNKHTTLGYSWLWLTATAGITLSGMDPIESRFTIDDSGVFGSGAPHAPAVPGGYFFVSQVGNQLFVNYSAVPEPGSLLFVALGAVGAAGYGWRRRIRGGAADNAGSAASPTTSTTEPLSLI